jgi:hypothetical protein
MLETITPESIALTSKLISDTAFEKTFQVPCAFWI